MSLLSTCVERVNNDFHARLIKPYQTSAVRWMLKREISESYVRGGLLADEMGLGKTVQMLATCAGNPGGRPTLIVCPKSIVTQWVDACRRFLRVNPLVVSAAQSKKIEPQEIAKHRIIVAPYSVLTTDDPANPLTGFRYHRVVLDEAHMVKNRNTKLYLGATSLKADIRWALTGTPVTGKRKDFLTLMGFLGAESRDIHFLRQVYTLRRTLEDVAQVAERLRLPPLEIKMHVVPFGTAEEARMYNDLKEEGKLRISAADKNGFSRDNTMGDVMEVITRIRQMTVNPQLVFDGRKEEKTWTLPVTKIEELLRLVEQQPRGSKALVFVHWSLEGARIQEELESRLGIRAVRLHGGMSIKEREEAVETFNDPSGAAVMISQIEAGGLGLNLQSATHVYINSLHWNASGELQAIGRAHRTGVTHKVTVTRLVVSGTIDEYICKVQQEKLGFAAEVLGDQRIQDQLKMRLSLKDIKHIFD